METTVNLPTPGTGMLNVVLEITNLLDAYGERKISRRYMLKTIRDTCDEVLHELDNEAMEP